MIERDVYRRLVPRSNVCRRDNYGNLVYIRRVKGEANLANEGSVVTLMLFFGEAPPSFG